MPKKHLWGIILILAIIAIPVFGHLDRLPILEWDESRLAMNAYEMLTQPGNILIPTYDGQPDMWNTKPPFLIWVQVLSMKALGVNELALRLPSAIAAGILCLFLYWFFAAKFKKPWLGIITCIVLVTSEGYISTHGTRTADYDSMLTLFTTVYTAFFFLYLEENRKSYIYLTCLFLTLAVLTKGIAALLFLPALLIYLFIRKRNLAIFSSLHVYVAVAAFLTVVLGYYFLREHYNPGYLAAIENNELGGRFSKVNEEHVGPWDFYLSLMLEWRFNYWIYLLPLGLYTGLRNWNVLLRRLTVYTILLIVVFFTVISTSQTKLDWYDTQLYPWMSIVVAIFIYTVFKSINITAARLRQKYDPLPILFLVLVFFVPYKGIYSSVVDPKIDPWSVENMNMGYMLKHAKEGKLNIDGYKLVWDDYSPNLYWYLKVFNSTNGVEHLGSNEVIWSAKPGHKIAVAKSGTKDNMLSRSKNLYHVADYHGVTVFEMR